MKIILISSRFHPFIGGVENVVLNLAREFIARGHKVLIIASRMGPAHKPSEIIEGVSVRRIWLNLPRSFLGFLAFPARSALGLIALVGQIRKFQPDVINYHFPDDSSVYVYLAISHYPLILNIHGNDLQIFGRKPWYRFFLKKLVRSAKSIVVNSGYIKDELGKGFPEAQEKTQIIPNGVGEEFFSLGKDGPCEGAFSSLPKGRVFPDRYTLFLGRLVPKKGVDVLIRAFAKARNELKNGLVIAGDGPERTKLENIVREANLERRVTFTGNQTGQAKLDLIRKADFAVIPSRREPFGLVTLELMAAGKAIIASRTGGLKELLENGQTALLFESENIEDLAEKMIELEKDPELRKRLGEAGRLKAQNYRWEKIASRYLSVFGA